MDHRITITSIGIALALSACRQEPSKAPEPIPTVSTAVTDTSTQVAPSPPAKVYKAADIEWEYAEDAIPYKAKVVAGINKLLRENDRCADVQTTSLYRAEGFSKKKPVFFILTGTIKASDTMQQVGTLGTAFTLEEAGIAYGLLTILLAKSGRAALATIGSPLTSLTTSIEATTPTG